MKHHRGEISQYFVSTCLRWFSPLPVFPATSFRCYQFSPLPVFAATNFLLPVFARWVFLRWVFMHSFLIVVKFCTKLRRRLGAKCYYSVPVYIQYLIKVCHTSMIFLRMKIMSNFIHLSFSDMFIYKVEYRNLKLLISL